MEFEDKYISISEQTEKPDISRISISDDAYAIGEMLSRLCKLVVKFQNAL